MGYNKMHSYRAGTSASAELFVKFGQDMGKCLKSFITLGVYKLLYVKGCQVQKVLFPMGRNSGLWLRIAYVILRSADDVDKALTKHSDQRYKESSTVKSMYFRYYSFTCNLPYLMGGRNQLGRYIWCNADA